MKTFSRLLASVRPQRTSIVVLVAVLAAACAGSKPAPVGESQPVQATQPPASGEFAGPAIDACSLVTKQEAEAALGKTVGDPMPENYPNNYSCKYETAALDNVGINVVVYDTANDAADAFQMELDINHYVEVSGIGDRALRPSPIMDLSVLKGRYELSIDIVSSAGTDESDFQAAKVLAGKALGRLP